MTLEPLLEPTSIAVIGASGRPGRPGHAVLAALRAAGYEGAVHPVTPTYASIEGWPCVPAIGDVDGPVDLAVIAGASERVAEQLAGAIAAGARAAYVLANAATTMTEGTTILDRVCTLARDAAIPLLGPNSLGFVNVAARAAVTWTPPAELRPGPVAIVSQSGSTYSYANNLDPRLRFSFTAHTGQEAVVAVHDLLRYAVALAGTRVVGVYLEAVADVPAIAAAFAEADARGVPVVVIRPGRGERSRRQIESHAGRMAGDDGLFEALFAAHGVVRARTVDEWWATITLLASSRVPARGGLGAVLCSGGARALLLDDGEDLGVPFAALSPASTARLAELVGPANPAENPVDVWDGQSDLAEHATACLAAVAADDDTAIAVGFTDFGVYDPAGFPGSFAAACTAVAALTHKPVVAATYTSRQFHTPVVTALAEAGIPVLDGMRNAVAAVGHALALRDRRERGKPPPPPPVDATALVSLLAQGAPTEAQALAALGALGIPVAGHAEAEHIDGAVAAAERLGFPVVLKATGANHKTDVDGVRLGLADAAAVRVAYDDLAGRLGPRVTVAAQVPAGVEVAAGVVRDPQFGPVLMIAAGGTLVELLDDRRFLLAPASAADVERALGQLRLAPLLDGVRGALACDVGALAATISRLSAVAAAAGDALQALDVNPIIAHPDGCTAVDALIIPTGGPE